MQKRQQKRDRERLEEARRPFEELNEQYVGFSETTGGIELMIGGKKQEKAAKVITIPTDRTYQQGFRAEKREEPEADSEYMSRQAENALKKLRAIIEYLKQYTKANRKEIDRLLWDKLPDSLSEVQKKNKIHNLLTSMKNKNLIEKDSDNQQKSNWVLK